MKIRIINMMLMIVAMIFCDYDNDDDDGIVDDIESF